MKKILLLLLLLSGWFLRSGFSQEKITLQQAIDLGLANNFSIRIQKNAVTIAKNNNTAGNAGFLPSVGLNVAQNNSVLTTHQEQFSGTVKDIANAKSSSLNSGAQLTWTVFDGMNMFVSHKMLATLEELGENGTRLVMEGFIADVSTLYYGIVQMKKLVRVTGEALELSVRRRLIAEAKLKIGSGSQLMLLQSTVDQNADSTRLLQQRSSLENLKADFNRLLGRDVLSAFDVQDTIPFSGIPSQEAIFALADKQNKQLMAARLQAELAGLGVKEAQSDRYPKINLNAGYGYNTLHSETGFLQQSRTYGPSYGFSLTYNLFNGFDVTRAVKNAKVMLNTSELESQDASLEIRNVLLKLIHDYKTNSAIVELQKENVSVARENMNIAFEKYKLGSLNDLELREIQSKLIEADYQYISAQFEVRKTEIGISRYCGELPDKFHP